MAVKTSYTGLEIAIIGLSGRFPGAEKLEQFWSNLVQGHESITFFTKEELIAAGVEPGLVEDPNFVPAKGVMPNLERFDAKFFNYTSRDAELMDPQVRVLHEVVFHALEDAGYASEPQRETIGLFLGATNNLTWELESLQTTVKNGGHHMTTLQFNDKDFAATRISYSLNLQGPSISVSSACSTSLYAVDMACRHILTGACSIAVAGGSGLSLPDRNGYLSKDGRINSPDGHCRPFDQDAIGTIEGNGAGMVVLKRLEDAVRDRDRIYAVIRGTACNNDGNRKVGYTAPSIEGQAEVIRRAIAMADIPPSSVSYIEAHGTGTIMGDPIEIAGLNKAYHSASAGSIGVGSLKSNIGHLDVAAGISSLIKTSLALKHQVIPATLHFQNINPQIDIENTPFYIVSNSKKWERKPLLGSQEQYAPLRAGVSSFGIGGTNVHMILEEAPERECSGPGREWKMLCLSARTDSALHNLKQAYADFLDQAGSPPDPSDLAWSQQLRQKSLPQRFTMVYREIDDLRQQLSAHLETGECPKAQQTTVLSGKPSVYFLFPGHGTQYLGMASDLYRTEPYFRDTLDECLRLVEAEGNSDVRRVLLNPAEGDEEKLMEADVSQLCLFVLEYSLAQMLMRWGIQPAGMIGHSLGEYTAACLAGVFTLPEAIHLVTHRGRLMISMPEGAMLSVNASADTVIPLLTDELSLAAINSGNKCTVSGTPAAIADLESRLIKQRIMSIRIQTNHGFHSFLMEGAMEPYAKIVTRASLREPQIPYISNVTGEWIKSNEALDPWYYARHLRNYVNFAKGIEAILADERAIMLEIGPGRTLSALARQAASGQPARTVNVLRDQSEMNTDDAYLAERLADLWRYGVAIDWKAYYEGQIRNRISLPSYPFDPTEFPIGARDLSQLIRAADGISEAAATVLEARHDRQIVSAESSQLNISELYWGPAFLLAGGHQNESTRTCLLLTDEQKLAKYVMDKLPECRSMMVHYGSAYHYGGTLGSVIRQGDSSDMRQLLLDLQGQALLPNTILLFLSAQDRTMQCLRLLVERLRVDHATLLPEIIVLSPHSSDSRISELISWIRATKVELPELNMYVLDAGVPLDGKKTAAAWSTVIRHELSADHSRYPAVSYINHKRCVPRMKTLTVNEAESQFECDHLVVLCEANKLADTLILTEFISEAFETRISVLPYRIGETDIQGDLKSLSVDGEIIRILPLVEFKQVKGLKSSLRSALEQITDAGGFVVWDEPEWLEEVTFTSSHENLKAASLLRQSVSEAAARLQVPMIVLSVIADASRWNREVTEWIVDHERMRQQKTRFHHIYLPEGGCPANLLTLALRTIIQSKKEVVAINLDNHPFLALSKHALCPEKEPLSEDKDLERELKRIWENLFGREVRDPNADFFELGGDSFKLIQMTVDLERLGYKVLMNEVYEYPTIASLVRYLRGKGPIGDQSISAAMDLERRLQESLGYSCRVVSIPGIETATILFVDDAHIEDIGSICQQIRSMQVNYEYLPDYILPLSVAERLPENFQLDDLVEQGILLDDEMEIVQRLDEQVSNAQQLLNEAIINQPVVRHYDLSLIQKMFLRGEMRLQLYSIDFRELVDVSLLERALCDIIGSHGLLRSSLHKQLWAYKWREYAPPQHTPLPLLDISRLTKAAQDKVVSELVKKEWGADFKVSGNPMYHVVLIKWSEKHYELFFQFDHSIIDLTSGQVIRRQLHKRYLDLLQGTRTAMDKSTGYGEFLQQVKRGPIGIDAESLISRFNLHTYYESKLRINEKLKHKRGRIQKLDFSIDLSSVRNHREDDQGYFEIAMQIYSLGLARLLEVETVPFDLYYVNRTYGGKSFSNVVGPAVDSIPFLIPARREDPFAITAHMRERIQWINEHNISFSNMEWNLASLWRWRKLLMVKGMYNKTIRGQLILNYSGNVEQEYEQIWDRSLMQLDEEDQKKLDYGDFYGLAKIKGSSLQFLILCKIEPDMDKIRRIFEEEAAHLLSFYQGTS